MAAPANDLQKAIYEVLANDTGVSALVSGRIFDRVAREGDVAPLITFGPSDEVDADADCIDMADHSLQIDVWSEYQGGFRECKEITFAIKQALHGAVIDLETHALLDIRVAQIRHMRDPDGLTSHGVLSIEAMVEER